MPMRRHVLCTLAAAALLAAGVAIFLRWADPFAILHFERGGTYRVDRYLRISKPHWVEGDWDTVVVGSSVSLRGIRPEALEKNLRGVTHAFNFGIDGATSYELRRHAEHAMAVAPVHRLLLEARPFLLAGLNTPHQFSEDRLAVSADGIAQPGWHKADLQRALFSQTALQRGLELLLSRKEIRVYRGNGEAVFQESGTYHGVLAGVAKIKSRRVMTTRAHLDNLAAVLDTACRKSVAVDVYLPPVHALALEALYRKDPRKFDRARREIAETVFEARRRCGGGAKIALWDFMIFSRFATEPIGAPEKATQYFVDATHFRRAVGDEIARTIGAGRGKSSKIAVVLTRANLEAHLKAQRQAHRAWRKTPAGRDGMRRAGFSPAGRD